MSKRTAKDIQEDIDVPNLDAADLDPNVLTITPLYVSEMSSAQDLI